MCFSLRCGIIEKPWKSSLLRSCEPLHGGFVCQRTSCYLLSMGDVFEFVIPCHPFNPQIRHLLRFGVPWTWTSQPPDHVNAHRQQDHVSGIVGTLEISLGSLQPGVELVDVTLGESAIGR